MADKKKKAKNTKGQKDQPLEKNGASSGAGDSKPKKLKRKLYEQELAQLHVELVKLQEWIKHKGLKVVVIFEGRDAAGKRSSIIKQAPWYVVNADDKRRARLNCIKHLLSTIAHEDLTPEPIELPPRQADGGYVRPPITDQTFVPEEY